MSAISGLTASSPLLSTTSSSGSTTPSSGITFTGLASGINTTNLINGLLAVDESQVTNLQNQETQVQTEQSDFQTVQTDLQSLQTLTQQLAQPVNNPLNGKTATVSDSNLVQAAAGTSAAAGVYSFTIENLATANTIASQGVSDPTAAIQTGTLTIQTGSASPATITIDNTNNSLQGLASAINSANAGVTASIVNDGSSGAGSTPYYLVLTSNNTGAENDIQITNNLNQGSGAAVSLTQTLQAGTDAQIQLGSQTNGGTPLTISSASNTVTSLIPGVTLNLQAADPNTPVSVTVANNVSSATQTITNFVDAFNAVVDYVNGQSTYNSTTQVAGPLLGNSSATGLVNSLTGALNTAVAGVNANANSLAAIGITFTASGDLSINSTTLNQALSGQLPGVSTQDVANLFALNGSTNSTGVTFLDGGNAQASPTGGYGVNITQAATQASVTATNAPLQSGSAIDSTDNTLNLTINGQTGTITLPTNASYTATTLAQALQSAINSSSSFGGAQVTVGANNGNLQIQTTNYGSATNVTINSGSALSALGFTSGQTNTGLDVAGSFVVNGNIEPATAAGQVLTGDSSNANTAGLAVQSTLTAPTTSPVTLNVTTGLAATLNNVLTSYLNPTTGQLTNLNNGFNSEITDIQTQITQQNTYIANKQAALTQQFTAMETAISQLQSVQTQLTNQLNATNNANSN